MAANKTVTLAQAAEMLGIGEFRMRALLREGKVNGTKVKVAEDVNIERWTIPVDEITRYQGARKSRDSKQFIAKVPVSKFELFEQFCKENGIEFEQRFTYVKKSER